ncbi:TolC family protein [Falsigemmobacter faecalis]|uniref:TolC family protein n=1 Tax=Falsigemmobacter faecalis TaxID=2488730 RepID=A0A3P3DHY1_9RHOB|nr:TolC family protein [Falsigemmobacter faecalis]RRH73845.1 TolC family protein [Falsigemmobacter faecalis]
MQKSVIGALALASAFTLSACDGMSNKATPERLEGLVEDGVAEKRLTAATAQFDKTMARANSIAALNSAFGEDATANAGVQPLSQMLEAALKRNPDIGRAAQQINRADAQRLRALFGYLPQVSLSYTSTTVDTAVVASDNAVFQLGTASYPVTTMTVELRQPLLDMSRIYGIRLGSTARTASELRYIATVQKALYETFDAYLEASQSKVKIAELKQRSGSLTRQATAESALTETGLSNDTSRRAIMAEQARTESDLAMEITRLNEALSRLSYLSGTAISDVQAISVPSGVLGTERRISAEAAKEAARRANPELTGIAMSVVQADLARKQAIASDFAPVIDLFMSMETEVRAGSRFGGGSETEETTTGIRVTLPIFNARGDGLRTLDANVDLRAAIVDFHAVRRQVDTGTTMTLERMKQLTASIGRLSQAHGNAAGNVKTERERMSSGESNDLLLAARERQASGLKMEVQVQQIEYLRAWAKLQYLTGAMTKNVLR